MTHAYKNRVGIRYLSNGLKVYHLALPVIQNEDTFPNAYAMLPLCWKIFKEEAIDIVHGHQVRFTAFCLSQIQIDFIFNDT